MSQITTKDIEDFFRQLYNGKPAEARQDAIIDRAKERTPKIDKDLARIVFDETAAEEGATKVQNDWIAYFNEQDRIMISASDIYAWLKQGEVDEDVLQSLRDDFKNPYLITSTRLIYSPKSLDGRIIQHYGANPEIIKPTEKKVIIPEYWETPIKKVVETPEGLAYLQAYFGTQDGADQIMQFMETLSNKKRDKIKVWTPEITNTNGYKTRAELPERAAVLNSYDQDFHLDGYDSPAGSVDGRSRGVCQTAPQRGV